MRRFILMVVGVMMGVVMVGGEVWAAEAVSREWMYANCQTGESPDGVDHTYDGIPCSAWCETVGDCAEHEEAKKNRGDYKGICSDEDAFSMLDDSLKEAAGCGLTENDRIENVGQTVINVAIGVTGLLAAIAIVMGGIQMVTSTGDPAKVGKGKAAIMYGVIALVVATLAAVIVNFVITAVTG